MFCLPLLALRPAPATCLILALGAGGDLAESGISFAVQPSVSNCQPSLLRASVALALNKPVSAVSPSNSVLLAQVPASQPIAPQRGEPVCTYDPPLPAQRQIIRGLW